MLKPVGVCWAEWVAKGFSAVIVLCDNGQLYQLPTTSWDQPGGPSWKPYGPPVPGTEADIAQQQEE